MDTHPPSNEGTVTRSRADGIRLSTGSVLASICILIAGFVGWALLSSSPTHLAPFDLPTVSVEATSIGATAEKIVDAVSLASDESYSQAKRDMSKPVWFRVDLLGSTGAVDKVLEIRILRFEDGRMWTLHRAADGSIEATPISVSPVALRLKSKSGYSVYLPKGSDAVGVLGELRSYMPNPPTAQLWTASDYAESEVHFERKGGALFGSLLILTAFSAIVSLLNRDVTFLLFCGWLVTTLRVSAINAGWDRHWLGIDLDNDLYLALLRMTIAAYGFFTLALFRILLLRPQSRAAVNRFYELIQRGFLLFVFLAIAVDHLLFLRAFWLYSSAALGAVTIYIVYSLFAHRNKTVVWYALSWGTMLFGMASEIGAQSGFADGTRWLTSQTASVISALIMGLALADRLRTEREARITAQESSLLYLKKYEENYNSMPIGLFALSRDGMIQMLNPAFEAMFSTSGRTTDWNLTSIDDIFGTGTFEKMKTHAATSDQELELGSVGTCEGRWYMARVSMNDRSIEGSIQDITARKAAENRLFHLVDHDHLTGLLNRRGVESAISEAIRSTRSGARCAVAHVDLDRLKVVNDLYGHGTGDTLIQNVAQRLKQSVRAKDFIGRLADSFVVVFVDCPDYAVTELTERIRQDIASKPFDVENKGLTLSVSIGVASVEPAITVSDALAAADRACSEAKARGRNCVVRLTDQDAVLRAHLDELRVVADLQQRVPTERYFLEFQPIVALQSAMSSLSYEVLIRMRGEKGEVVPPGKFIGAAERNGLMSQIDRWVLLSTLEWLDSNPEHRDRLSFATLNISGASLNDTRFVDDAFSMIAEHPHAMPKLCFEITESVALHDLGSTRRFVDRVRMYGSKLALDDFGAGYTSFNYLKEIPADFIKIDGSFVKDINRNPANYAITRTIVDLTHELGMRSIAEWAETPDTVASLIDLGVDYGQGFGLVRPSAPSVLAAASSGGELITDPAVRQLLLERARSGSSGRRDQLPSTQGG